MTARELLQRGEHRLDSLLVEDPDVRARLLGVLGVIHTDLGLYGRADSLLARAVTITRESRGPESPELAAQLSDWADALSEEAKYAAADSAARQALAIAGAASGPMTRASRRAFGHSVRLPDGAGSSDSAEAFYREALAIDRRLFGDDQLVVAEDSTTSASHSRTRAACGPQTARWPPPSPYGGDGWTPATHPHSSRCTTWRSSATAWATTRSPSDLKREVLQQRRRLYPDGHPHVAGALRELGSPARALDAASRRPNHSTSRRAPCSRRCWALPTRKPCSR